MTLKPTVYVLDPYHEDAIARLRSADWIDLVLCDEPRKAEWHKDAVGVMVRSDTRLTAEDFAAASELRVVVKQGVGVDNIDLAAAKAAAVAVHNTPALNSESVAEFSLALALSLCRRVAEVDRRVRKGEKLVRSEMLGLSLFGKTVGVVGMGNIGKCAAKKWIGACESRILAYDPIAPHDVWDRDRIPHIRVSSLDELLKEADVVTLHVPLLDSTRGMIGARELASMKDKGILINAARGGIVDEKALLDELRKKRLWGAVLDAAEVEPPTLEAYGAFLELDNVIMTPHIGASTIENQSSSGLAVVRTLLAVLEGKDDVPGKLV
ncbi:D-isomer specific 2-hydroxyacid dehydrogenase, NAD-binding [Pleurostoma richardsiae]|uniref:D-isomer specific 2-hydroxyacid dehydrogenase, NAD-binding n=1 Tax=Pleurostoma richardsiae TaxID=41990 RepID=A0AA38R1U0_9PEZI|nr:D-isomer specific 2-hydroxyacid dehydrogenase, NAD-binding [Pleurostoma richardsiae]